MGELTLTKGNEVEELRALKQVPLIAVIGSRKTSEPYNRELGMIVGNSLRSTIEYPHNGTIYTGGAPGVGEDVAMGVARYVLEEYRKTGQLLDPRFFIMIPPKIGDTGDGRYIDEPFGPTKIYRAAGAFSPSAELDIVWAGEGLAERREILAKSADMAVMLHGSAGTLDEAYYVLANGRPVIVMSNSGDGAKWLSNLKSHRLPRSEDVPEDILPTLNKILTETDTYLIIPVSAIHEVREEVFSRIRMYDSPY